MGRVLEDNKRMEEVKEDTVIDRVLLELPVQHQGVDLMEEEMEELFSLMPGLQAGRTPFKKKPTKREARKKRRRGALAGAPDNTAAASDGGEGG